VSSPSVSPVVLNRAKVRVLETSEPPTFQARLSQEFAWSILNFQLMISNSNFGPRGLDSIAQGNRPGNSVTNTVICPERAIPFSVFSLAPGGACPHPGVNRKQILRHIQLEHLLPFLSASGPGAPVADGNWPEPQFLMGT
jgi:hypothetical protein